MYKNYDYGRVPEVVSHLSVMMNYVHYPSLYFYIMYCIYVWSWHVNKQNFHGILDNKIILFYSVLHTTSKSKFPPKEPHPNRPV